MRETYRCPECGNTPKKVVKETIEEDRTKFLLECNHEYSSVSRGIFENVNISDTLSAKVTHVISFVTEEDRSRGFSTLILSGSSFSGLERNKFVVTPQQCTLLENKKINFERLD